MGRIGIDVSAIVSPFDTVPEDNYRIRCNSSELAQSKENQHNMLKFEYEIVGGEFAGRKLFDIAMLEGKAQQSGLFKVNQWCHAAGSDPTDPDPDDFIGAECDAEVTIEEGDRGPQNRVKLLIDVTGSEEEVTQEIGNIA